MTDLEQQLADHLRRRAAAATPRYDLEGIEQDHGDAAVLDVTNARHRRRASLWLAVAAVTVLLAIVGALTLLDDHQNVDTAPVTEVPVVPDPLPNDDGPTTLVKAQDLNVGGLSALTGRTLNIDAVERVGEVTGELRVDNIVVTLQCADTEAGDLILGGEVTDDPDGQGLVYNVQGGTRARRRYLGRVG